MGLEMSRADAILFDTMFIMMSTLAVICFLGLFLPMYWDHVVVWFLRTARIYAFPVAINIAMSIEHHPEQWNSDGYRLSHPIVGSIWTGNEAYGLHIETPFGDWKPNKIERRIIRNAVDWRQKEYVKGRLGMAMQKIQLPG